MATRGGGTIRRTLRSSALPLLILVLVGAVGVGLWWRGDLNAAICDGDCGPAYVTPPDELAALVAPSPQQVPRPPSGVDGSALLAAVEPALGADALGKHVGFVAVDPTDGAVLATVRGDDPFVPASTTKVLTSFAALSLLEPDRRFATRVVAEGPSLTLVGGGDPYLTIDPAKKSNDVARADLTTLATITARDLKRRSITDVSVEFDDRLFVGPDESPEWEASYVRNNIVSRVSPLWVNRGLNGGSRVSDPAAFAAAEFVRLLNDRGIGVRGEPTRGRAAGDQIAAVKGATVAEIVDNLLLTSDNEAAEVMLRQAALADGREASFAGGVAAVRRILDDAGAATAGLVLHDGSGLSRANRITPTTLVTVLYAALDQPRTASLFSDLPVAGYSGSLLFRFSRASQGVGLVRAKTGTLTGVHSLAGVATLSGGRPVVFAVMADRTGDANPFASQDALDAVAADLVDCPCQVLGA